MGRELKRVPLDFDWPLNRVWSGYMNPHYKECPDCEGSGSTLAYSRLQDLVSLILLSGEDALSGKSHPYFNEVPLYRTRGRACGKDMAELTTGLAGREPGFIGHDACDRYSAAKKIIKAAGLSESWGTCASCDGEGVDKTHIERYNAWKPTEPPVGEGYQIWETVSEGSPISPVFQTPEELARHMAGKAWGADNGSSYETWLKFIIGPGWAPSGVLDSTGFKTGPHAGLTK